jgi:hypothetical protein
MQIIQKMPWAHLGRIYHVMAKFVSSETNFSLAW